MKSSFFPYAVLLVVIVTNSTSRADWPQFRGRNALGVAEHQNLPDEWDVEKGTNVRWRTPIPGLGHACPIVSRGCVFIVTADNGEQDPELKLGLYGNIESVKDDRPHDWVVYCLSLQTGKVIWKRLLHRGVPAIKRHTKASHANITPATDGRRIVVFLGSEGLYCLDFCGALLWKKDLGVLDSGYFRVPAAQWGFASSPIIYGDKIILQCDVQKNSFLAAYSIYDGRQLWRTERKDVPTWSTPAVVIGPHRTELVVNGYKHAGGYDPTTGKPLWRLSGGGDIPVPTPIYAHNLIFLSSAHGAVRPLWAVRPGAVGEVKVPQGGNPIEGPLAWYQKRSGIYMQTPIVYGDYLYACRNNGVMTCHEAITGKRVYQKRIGSGGFTASAVAADGKLYFTNEDGKVTIVAAGPDYQVVATNPVGGPVMATPAIAGGMLLVRTTDEVIAIGRPQLPVTSPVRRWRRLPLRWRKWRFGR